ncbi:glycoside hydrolase family 3 C-terminal domain-containing protein [Pinibacter aurantiacus]|uniref:Glycoside hydrolase family 3 C-terminal domain-containing protein n=1 Tax=Pinibacter aurantiacus TaxID=2851599 RepID=A0A9E2SFE4_9BACT|nr:glycoside hydrolase family 3 C-terminal domain-containing protein [Pinibacter aurantiacus]MBV4360314.1 glycoside hydrolase family 3 C-terminal domain-containing protein [Pinibacter aurantiacus]
MKRRFCITAIGIFTAVSMLQAQTSKPVYLDITKAREARVQDLLKRMTLAEKVSQMMNSNSAIPRLQIPEYNWWNESLHGVARSGVATVFPQAIGLSATFDEKLALKVSTAISDEARAIYNVSIAKGYRQKYAGLTFWTPNINIFRDPRWGRGQETYGEDPFLTSRIGVAFVKGLQGNDPNYLKVAACAKHYAVHSGPERLRHEFDAKASMKDMRETYLPAFKALVTEANVEAVMCAYNRTNREVCCGNTFLLQDVLRDEWKFKGHVVSDCGAIEDFYKGHKVVANSVEAAALAVKRGVSLDCGGEYASLIEAVKQNLITEKEVDSALAILLRTKMKLGIFDPASSNPYSKISANVINSAEHRALSKEVALKSIVLLKNNGALPLRSDLKKYFVTGPNAADVMSLIGNYYGVNPQMVTYMEGIASHISPESQMQYRPGCLLDRHNINPIDWTTDEARNTEATIVVLGINGLMEGEEGESIASPSFGDRLDYNIPQNQVEFLRKMKKDNPKPVIAVITGGSPMNLSEIHDLADAVLLAWYPGEEGGNAVADIIFGKVSPSGKLPVTFPKSLQQLPSYEDYSMKGRTYRYMTEEPMYPFGYGLTYSKFDYGTLKTSTQNVKKGQPMTVETTVTNKGKTASDEVIQLYVSHPGAGENEPLYSLKGFTRINLAAGASKVVKFTVTPDMLSLVNDNGETLETTGKVTFYVGGSSPMQRSETLGIAKPAVGNVAIVE